MAKPLKEKGIEEADALQTRVRRQYTLRRISQEDFGHLDDLLNQFKARVDSMNEVDDETGGNSGGR